MNLAASLSPECQLLLACVKLEPTPEDLRRIDQEIKCPTVDWDRVVDRAYHHDVAPLMYNTIRRFDASVVSTKRAFAKLKTAYCANAARNTLLFNELEKILRMLAEQGKPVIVLKGAALGETVYPNRALRPMSDLDLLIRKDDFAEVEKLLGALGYAMDEKQWRMKEWHFANYHHIVFQRKVVPSLTLCCEIHWYLERPTRPFPIDIDGVWKRAVPAIVAGAPALVLCPEDLLLHLCLHTCKHRLTGGFRAFCDIAETVRHFGDLNWKQVLERASEWRISTFVYVPLRLAQELLGAPPPEWVMKMLEPGDFDNRLLAAATGEVLENRLTAALFQDFFQLSHGQSLSERALVVKKAFSHTSIRERYAVAPSSRTIFRYYPRRLKDLMTDYGAELWRFLRMGREAAEKADDRSRLSEWLAPFGNSGTEDDA